MLPKVNLRKMIILILFINKAAISFGQTISQNYEVLEEAGKIVNSDPFHEVYVTSTTECFLTSLRTSEKFYLVEIEGKSESQLVCRLFKKLDFCETTKNGATKVYGLVDENKVKCKNRNIPGDCMEWYNDGFADNGVYAIQVNNIVKDVYCDMKKNGGGWTVIQRRYDGSVSFRRTWKEYKDGFGDAYGEYWLGNELIHLLTYGTDNKIRISGTTFAGEERFVIGRGFFIEDEDNKCKLHAGNFTGSQHQSLSKNWKAHDGMKFSTKDIDNDRDGERHCSQYFGGGWWFEACQKINLNGPYSTSEKLEVKKVGIMWYKWLGIGKSLAATEIAIKRDDGMF